MRSEAQRQLRVHRDKIKHHNKYRGTPCRTVDRPYRKSPRDFDDHYGLAQPIDGLADTITELYGAAAVLV